MKLGTLNESGPDGRLVVVSPDGARFLRAEGIARTLQTALERWDEAEPGLRRLAQRLNTGEGEALSPQRLLAPLPRAWQWLDGSAYRSHGELMERLFGVAPPPPGKPLMYQGLSHQFLSPNEDVPLPREEDGIDFEGEFGLLTDFVPMGTLAAQALGHIKLLVQINDWSLRALAPGEMKTGFGWIQAKPACSMAPFAVTPDELGDFWRDGRIHRPLKVAWNGARFGEAEGGAMEFGFHDLIAHGAATRSLCAGTIIGSGTVANENYAHVGSSCIAERRAIETLEAGEARTGFMRFGDRVRMEATMPDGAVLFGAIDQRVVRAN